MYVVPDGQTPEHCICRVVMPGMSRSNNINDMPPMPGPPDDKIRNNIRYFALRIVLHICTSAHSHSEEVRKDTVRNPLLLAVHDVVFAIWCLRRGGAEICHVGTS